MLLLADVHWLQLHLLSATIYTATQPMQVIYTSLVLLLTMCSRPAVQLVTRAATASATDFTTRRALRLLHRVT